MYRFVSAVIEISTRPLALMVKKLLGAHKIYPTGPTGKQPSLASFDRSPNRKTEFYKFIT